MTIALGLLLLAAPAPAAASAAVQLVWLPPQTTVSELARAGLSPGLMSAGLGTVPPEQTYLDVGQGNRLFDSLYDTDLPPLPRRVAAFGRMATETGNSAAHGSRAGMRSACAAWWKLVQSRAASAPAEIVPGLLTRTLKAAGVAVRARGGASCTFSPPPTSDGRGRTSKKLSGTPRPHGPQSLFEVREGTLRDLPSLRRALRGQGLLIAVARPTGRSDDLLPIGIAGHGFAGDLTSDSTRIDGYVLSTDLAPTILDRLAIPVPSPVSGQPIRAAGASDPAAVESLGARMEVISGRRGPVIGIAVALWLAALALLALAGRARLARPAVRVVALSVVYLPLVLLLGAALEPGQGAERLLVLALPPLLAAATLRAAPGYGALAVASGATVAAYAIDVVLGSPLTSLSLLGPNPGLGVRFYGIGNELEALLAVLVVAGTGAGLAAFGGGLAPRRAAVWFLAIGLAAAIVFAAGRFGADVGAAIVLPIGAATAAAAVAGRRRARSGIAVAAAPLALLAVLVAVDLASGANAHLTRSVLDAGGLEDLADVAQRRLQLSAHSFARPVLAGFLPIVALVAALALARRDQLRAWLASAAALRAGLVGAVTATVVGTLANDSGALLLVIGTAYLLTFVGFAWAQSGGSSGSGR
jgi:hypothetical protein